MAAEMLKAPWTDDQVLSLNEYQEAGVFYPFTCGKRDGLGQAHVLKADKYGWWCPHCADESKGYVQNWCHEWMANWEWKKAKVMP
jgi:hypothetical protein